MEATIKGGTYFVDNIDVYLAKKGNKEAFVKLIMENEKTMYRVAKNYLSSDEDVIDVIGEATLKAYEKLKSLRNNSYFKTWLIRILINECYIILRKNKREVLDFEESVVDEIHIDSYEDLDLYKAMELLPSNMRLVLSLHYYDDLSVKDISCALDIKENTVKTNLKRGREKLYALLKGGEYHE
ncbi:sigma-70 family RNA polymerase sigma factor [Clostridium gasigenes]|uniref:Sigma-70 family RNA polymerase sigma factor n=1 Tax=Clostridium gasigenes TaxID=94869 RepID=A0A7X0R8E2_9CLOT|nr:sigma-70 family RNA polymerase sigma factor [Clostridium gasigenes]MBB6623586.1 sigma-70 family RNA polymerase sigma factor [Clostridium gasigenes]MBB6715662.1 sigma-70 family RNA polymerase sigma factor [Clostridium gasigenes]MBU3087613.1 sigma-70 family RNA polymerase sigma factor [Clostridium gasigenes]